MNPTCQECSGFFFFFVGGGGGGGGGWWPGVFWGTEGYLGLLDKSRVKRGQGRENLGAQGRKERNSPLSHHNSLPIPTPAMQAKAE